MSTASRAQASNDERAHDARLVAEMTRGDSAALGELYDRHSPVLLGLAARILRSATEAEDLVQDVFLEAWRHAADYDPARGSVRAWLILRARSRAIDRRKSAPVARTVWMSDEDWLDRQPAPGIDASFGPDRGTLRRVLAQLPEEQRTVLWLGYFEGLSSSEIAERIHAPIGTVKSRVAAALARLRDELGEVAS